MSNIEKAVDDSEISKVSKPNLKRFFNIARGIRNASDWRNQKHGAVITYKNKVMAVGWNTEKETPMQKYFNRYRHFNPETNKNSSHAEINALIKLNHFFKIDELDKNKLAIFIYREHKNGDLALSRPCKACENAICQMGIKNVFYTGEDSIIYEHKI